MGDDLNKKLQFEVDGMIKALEREVLRPLQRQTYLKMAACLENASISQEQANNCVERTQAPLQMAQNVVQNEMNNFQNKLQRCGQTCQDDIQDQITPDVQGNTAKMQKFERQMMDCMAKCGEKHIQMLKPMSQKMRTEIASRTPN